MSFLDGQAVEAMKHVVPLVDLSEEELALGFPATTAAGRARLQHVCASIWTFVRLCSFMLGGHERAKTRLRRACEVISIASPNRTSTGHEDLSCSRLLGSALGAEKRLLGAIQGLSSPQFRFADALLSRPRDFRKSTEWRSSRILSQPLRKRISGQSRDLRATWFIKKY